MTQPRPQTIFLIPRHEECSVAAVDASNIKIGETDRGILVAVRGSTVWKQKRGYHYARFGPFIFHITEDNKKDLYGTLSRAYFNASHDQNFQGTPNLLQMPMRIAGLLEKWLQQMIVRVSSKGLVLFDGSLSCGTGDSCVAMTKEILGESRKKENVVLAFSKMTNLRVNGRFITDMLPKGKPPLILEMAGLRARPPILLLGKVYLARLTNENYSFRLDVDGEVASEQRVEAVERLLGNELLSQGYPETLRLAHIFCTFTANEVLAMQHFASQRFRVRIVNRPDMHRLLFGPYGRGECYS